MKKIFVPVLPVLLLCGTWTKGRCGANQHDIPGRQPCLLDGVQTSRTRMRSRLPRIYPASRAKPRLRHSVWASPHAGHSPGCIRRERRALSSSGNTRRVGCREVGSSGRQGADHSGPKLLFVRQLVLNGQQITIRNDMVLSFTPDPTSARTCRLCRTARMEAPSEISLRDPTLRRFGDGSIVIGVQQRH